MSRPAERRLRLAAALLCALPALAHAQVTLAGPAAPEASHGPLQTFALAKPSAPAPAPPRRDATVLPSRVPRPTELLRTSLGVGYVQGADWGSELFATGGVSGTQVQLNALVTRGREGLRFDNGSLSVFDPDRLWRVEAGDLFSQLRGAAFGGRLGWAGRGGRRPAVSVYATRRGLPARDPVVSYRDQLRVKGQTLLDAELASDRSYLLRTHLTAARLEVEALYRSQHEPFVSRDASLSAGVTLWRGIGLAGGFFRSRQTGDRQEWRMAAVRLPLTRTSTSRSNARSPARTTPASPRPPRCWGCRPVTSASSIVISTASRASCAAGRRGSSNGSRRSRCRRTPRTAT